MQACVHIAPVAGFSTIHSIVAATASCALQPQVGGNRLPSPFRQSDSSWSFVAGSTADAVDRTARLRGFQSLKKNLIRAATGDSASTSTVAEQQQQQRTSSLPGLGNVQPAARVLHITSVQQFDEALAAAKNKLVVVEYAATHSANSRSIYPSMVELSKSCQDVIFLLVLGDESDATKELCLRAGVDKVPHFIFYKNSEKIHEEKGLSPEQLEGDVLYYGDNDAPIHQVHSRQDFDILLRDHASDHKLVVLDVGLKSCGPCVKVYPTVVKLSKKMADTTIFARMHGDENEDCMDLIRLMGVVEVPTFVFIRDGKPLGRYVGSGKGELIGEILRYNGVRVTY